MKRPGQGFLSPSAPQSTIDDGSCTFCSSGKFSASGDASECEIMSGMDASTGCPVNFGYVSSTDRPDLTGAVADDGTCVACSTISSHHYKAFTGNTECYLYTCSIGGNRCKVNNYKCCESGNRQCQQHNGDVNYQCIIPSNPDDYDTTGCAAGYKYCADAGGLCLKEDGSEPCLCSAGRYKVGTSCVEMTTSTCSAGLEFSSASAFANPVSPDQITGATLNDGECTTCPVGKYKSTTTAQKCSTCPVGHRFDSSSTDCFACSMGQFQSSSTTPSVGCTKCGRGKFAGATAAIICAGKYTKE